MAILTVQQLLVAARIITDATDVPAQTLAVANALYPGCVALINQYAPMASDDVKNLALERLFSWMWESDVQSGGVSDPLQASGALSLLSLAGVVAALSTVASLPAITGFTVGDIINVGGELYELVANTDDANVLRGTIFQRMGNYWGSAATGEVDFEFTGVSPYNTRLNIIKTDLPSSPTNLYIKITMSSGQVADIVMGRSSASDTTSRYAYNKVEGQPGLDVPTAGETYRIEVFSDSGFSTAQSVHAAHRWEANDRESPVIPVALVGNNDRWPKVKVPSDTVYTADLPNTPGQFVLDEQFPGLTLTRTDADSRPAAPTYFTQTIDLDDHSHGEFHCSLELTIAPVSDVNMGFTMNKANQTAEDKQRTLSNIVFASDVSEEDTWAFAASGSVNGLNVFTVPVYSLNTLAGTYYLLLVKNATNQVGAYHYYDGAAGATGATFTAELRVTFTPSDTVLNRHGGLVRKIGSQSINFAPAGNRNFLATTITIPDTYVILQIVLAGDNRVTAGIMTRLWRLRNVTATTAGTAPNNSNAITIGFIWGDVIAKMYFGKTSTNLMLVNTSAELTPVAEHISVYGL